MHGFCTAPRWSLLSLYVSRASSTRNGSQLRRGGVLGVLPGMIGVMQAIEAVKLILGTGEPLIGRLISFDALKMRFREFKVRKDPNCPICGEHPTIHELIDYEQFCGLPQADAEAEQELAGSGMPA